MFFARFLLFPCYYALPALSQLLLLPNETNNDNTIENGLKAERKKTLERQSAILKRLLRKIATTKK